MATFTYTDKGMLKEHRRLVDMLEKRGAQESLLDVSNDAGTLQFAQVLQDDPKKVLNFLLEESKEGTFRRHIVYEFDVVGTRRLMVWQVRKPNAATGASKVSSGAAVRHLF